MTEALAEKTCALCRGGIPPLTRDEAQRLQAQARDWQLADDAHASSARFGSAISGNRWLLFRKSASSPRPKDGRRHVLESPALWPKRRALSPAGRISLRTPQMDGKSPWIRARAV